MKVFLSLGKSNKTNEEIIEDLKNFSSVVIEVLKEEEIKLVSNKNYYEEEGKDDDYYMKKSMNIMDGCDLVVFHPDFENYRECLLDERVADLQGINKFYL